MASMASAEEAVRETAAGLAAQYSRMFMAVTWMKEYL
jgi:hypothetical protein